MSAPGLAGRTWPEVATDGPLVLALPLGSCEQHGPHLPLDTDTRIAVALAERLAARAPAGDIIVGPPLTVGASWEHRGFPGLLSITNDLLADLLVEMVHSAEWVQGVVVVNGHGGNMDGVTAAGERLTAEGRQVLSWWPRTPGGDAHAGRTETSIMLTLDPDAVRLDRLEPGYVGALTEAIARGVAAVSPNGILGDPTGASAAEGETLLDVLTGDLVAAVEHWRSDADA